MCTCQVLGVPNGLAAGRWSHSKLHVESLVQGMWTRCADMTQEDAARCAERHSSGTNVRRLEQPRHTTVAIHAAAEESHFEVA